MRLDDYFARIGYRGGTQPTLETLTAVHRAHLLAVPYENIDVALRRPVTRDPRAAFEKIVTRRRGGWCYEMNGLLGWALDEMGFSVTRLAGGVHRATLGDSAIGNHLVLRVDLDQPYIADIGFGDGMLDPITFTEGEHIQRGFKFRLEKLDDRYWRFHNHENGSAPSFDFADEPADPALLEEKCLWLQGEGSPFFNNVVLQTHNAGGMATMRGRTLRLVRHDGVDAREISELDDYRRVLESTFSLPTGDAPLLWKKLSETP